MGRAKLGRQRTCGPTRKKESPKKKGFILWAISFDAGQRAALRGTLHAGCWESSVRPRAPLNLIPFFLRGLEKRRRISRAAVRDCGPAGEEEEAAPLREEAGEEAAAPVRHISRERGCGESCGGGGAFDLSCAVTQGKRRQRRRCGGRGGGGAVRPSGKFVNLVTTDRLPRCHRFPPSQTHEVSPFASLLRQVLRARLLFFCLSALRLFQTQELSS